MCHRVDQKPRDTYKTHTHLCHPKRGFVDINCRFFSRSTKYGILSTSPLAPIYRTVSGSASLTTGEQIASVFLPISSVCAVPTLDFIAISGITNGASPSRHALIEACRATCQLRETLELPPVSWPVLCRVSCPIAYRYRPSIPDLVNLA